jgi:hypothetical protein
MGGLQLYKPVIWTLSVAYKIALMRGKKVAVARKAKQLDIEDLLEIKASL